MTKILFFVLLEEKEKKALSRLEQIQISRAFTLFETYDDGQISDEVSIVPFVKQNPFKINRASKRPNYYINHL